MPDPVGKDPVLYCSKPAFLLDGAWQHQPHFFDLTCKDPQERGLLELLQKVAEQWDGCG